MSEPQLQCPICSSLGVLIHKGTRDVGAIDVYQCSNCGTKFLSNLDGEKDYENGFMHEKNPLSGLDMEKKLQSLHKDDKRRFEKVKELCRNKKVLDFGCGFGGFLNYCSEVTDMCCGVELGKDERDYLKSKGIRCFRTIDETEDKFDVITLFHVFEHLSDPESWLDKFSDYLADNGQLIIEVPHANDILLSLYANNKFADFTYWSAHLFLFTAESLSMLVERSGKYLIMSSEYIQRYSFANHMMWLAKGLPGGHNEWDYLDSGELNEAYTKKLQELKMCDTLFFVLRKKKIGGSSYEF